MIPSLLTPSPNSSAIAQHGYDAESKTARIEFRGGRIHEFPGVEPTEYEAFAAAPSLGKHFHQQWRGRDHRRIA
ncbi:MAG: KTSC domain-containing protein [Bryobacteraceae bacterium]|jgi:hypothetical protein